MRVLPGNAPLLASGSGPRRPGPHGLDGGGRLGVSPRSAARRAPRERYPGHRRALLVRRLQQLPARRRVALVDRPVAISRGRDRGRARGARRLLGSARVARSVRSGRVRGTAARVRARATGPAGLHPGDRGRRPLRRRQRRRRSSRSRPARGGRRGARPRDAFTARRPRDHRRQRHPLAERRAVRDLAGRHRERPLERRGRGGERGASPGARPIVRILRKVGSASAGVFHGDVAVALEATWAPRALRFVAFVQRATSRRIVGASAI